MTSNFRLHHELMKLTRSLDRHFSAQYNLYDYDLTSRHSLSYDRPTWQCAYSFCVVVCVVFDVATNVELAVREL
jgi:hypothetical protein